MGPRPTSQPRSIFLPLGMFYSSMWGYLDHFVGHSPQEEVVPFEEAKAQKAVKLLLSRTLALVEGDKTIQNILTQDYQQFIQLAKVVNKLKVTDVAKRNELVGKARRFASYLLAQSQRYGELARQGDHPRASTPSQGDEPTVVNP